MTLDDKVKKILGDIVWAPGESAESQWNEIEKGRSSKLVKKAIEKMGEKDLMRGEAGRIYFFDLLEHPFPGSLAKAYIDLNEEQLLTIESRDVFKEKKHPKILAEAYIELSKGGLLIQEIGLACWNVVHRHRHPLEVAKVLVSLSQLGTLTLEKIILVKKCRQIVGASAVVDKLKIADLASDLYLSKFFKHGSPFDFAETLIFLRQEDILVEEYLDLLEDPQKLMPIHKLRRALSGANILKTDLGRDFLRNVIKFQRLGDIAEGISQLKNAGMLVGESGLFYCKVIAMHLSPKLASQVVVMLHKYNLLNETNYNRLFSHPQTSDLIRILAIVESRGLWKVDGAAIKLNRLLGDLNLGALLQGLEALNQVDYYRTPIVTSAMRDLFVHPSPNVVSGYLCTLIRQNLLTELTCRYVMRAQEPSRVVDVVVGLNSSGLLSEVNLEGMFSRLEPSQQTCLSVLLSRTRMFADRMGQQRFDRLLSVRHILLSGPIYRMVWQRMPEGLYGRPIILDQMIAIAEHNQHNPIAAQQALILYINQFNVAPRVEGVQQQAVGVFNAPQITHTASIHQSVSESALRLRARYFSRVSTRQLNIDKLIELKGWLMALQDSFKVLAARKAMVRLVRPLGVGSCVGSYQDPTSKVKVVELLIYVWMAMHDEALRIGTLPDATARFIDVLYEIQRGRNINQNGFDIGGEDAPICPSGTFNKLMETLVEIHPDVQMVFISREGAALKFKIVVEEEAMNYLTHLAQSGDKGQHQQFKQFVDGIKPEEGLPEELWAFISARVADRMFDEFGSLYPAGRASPEFLAFIAAGESVSIQPRNVTQLAELPARFMPAVVDSQELLFEPFDPNGFFTDRRGPDEDPELEPDRKRARPSQ